MNDSRLRQLLIKQKLMQSSPLFVSAADLAKQICKDSSKRRLSSTVATLLSNVFAGRRLCSDDLKNDILKSIKRRYADLPQIYLNNISSEIALAAEEHNSFLVEAGSKDRGLVDAELLFRRLSRPEALLIVEYRDQPRATLEARYSGFVARAGEAVSKGLHFAMIQPFCADAYIDNQARFYHTAAIRHYIYGLVLRTREVYLAILKAALDRRGSQSKEQVAKRMVLYERTTHNSGCFVSGIQSRIFLAEIPNEDKCGRSASREVWEWVAGKQKDYFLQRDEASMPIEVISQQFLHITKFWMVHKVLPLTERQIEETVGFWGRQLGARLPPKLWSVFKSPKKSFGMVEEAFGSKEL